MRTVLSGEASRFVVVVITAVAAALPQYFGTASREPIVVYAPGALGVYLVPNSPPPAVPPPAVPPPAPAPCRCRRLRRSPRSDCRGHGR